MNKFKTKIFGLTIAALLSVGALVPATSSALTIDELMAQIVALQAELQKMQGTTSTADKCSFTRSLTVGSKGEDVTCLQNYLKTAGHLSVNATGFFGSLTKSAVVKWQSANSVTPASGYFGSISRAKYDSLMTTSSSSSSSTTSSSSSSVVATGGGLTITSATQPTATLAVQSGARIPFTKVTLTAGSQDVVVTGVTVERTGLANDAVFSGVVLLDETGSQLGIAKTFNSDHRAITGDTVTIKAGTSKTFTIAGNMASSLTSYAGQVVSLSVVSVSTSATVSGTLPITGAGHTINASLTVGSVTNNRGSIDPNSSTGSAISKEVGTTGYTFASVKFTAGSAEKIKVKSIRWNQSGSAATSDLANIKTYIDSTAYDTVVSSDGKYYTATFGTDGILVDKGNSVEISVKGDIAGGSGRTVDFDIYKNTDVYMTGETYGYGITAPLGSSDPTDDSSNFSSGNPWYDASQISVSAGTLTVEKATSVAADNIAVNISNQKLGGFIIEAKGEAITVASTVFTVASSSGSGYGLLTNVSLVDENGTIVAGPVDGVYSDATHQTVTFTDTISYGIGKKTYTLKGKVSSTIGTNTTYSVATTPSSNWTSVTGQTTGNSITPSPTSAVTANTMTVKAAVATVSVSASPVAQTIVGGVSSFNFANFTFDASASGEDIKFSSLALRYAFTTVASNTLTGCKLKDGTTEVNTDSPSLTDHTTGNNVTFTLSSAGLVIPKGTTKIIALNCNVASNSSGNYTWGMTTAPSGTGLTSGQSVTATLNSSNGQQIALGSGSLTISGEDASYVVAPAGTSGVTLGVLKVSAINEAINLKKIALKLTNATINGTASSTFSDLGGYTLYDGLLPVSQLKSFSATTSTTTLTSDFIIPKGGYKLLTIKGDLASVGLDLVGQQGALVIVDYVGAGNAEGTSQSNGETVTSTSGATSFPGVRMFRSYPTVAVLSSGSADVNAAADIDLYKFSVKANPSSANGVGLHQFTVNIATTSGSAISGTTTVTNLKVYAYTDSGMSSPVGGSYTNGQVVDTISGLVSSGDNDAQLSSVLQIPAGSTYYFKVVGTATKTVGTGTYSGSVTTKISGDTVYPSLSTLMGIRANVDTGSTFNKFVWSPNATTTSSATHVDWTNGYYVAGLPSTGTTVYTVNVK